MPVGHAVDVGRGIARVGSLGLRVLSIVGIRCITSVPTAIARIMSWSGGTSVFAVGRLIVFVVVRGLSGSGGHWQRGLHQSR